MKHILLIIALLSPGICLSQEDPLNIPEIPAFKKDGTQIKGTLVGEKPKITITQSKKDEKISKNKDKPKEILPVKQKEKLEIPDAQKKAFERFKKTAKTPQPEAISTTIGINEKKRTQRNIINPLTRFSTTKAHINKHKKLRTTEHLKSPKVLSEITPITIQSSDTTHRIKASGLQNNIIVMPENVMKAFSSRNLGIEIRGPIVTVRIPSNTGREIDLQIITESMKAESFLMVVDNKLSSQKIIITKKETKKPHMFHKANSQNGSYGAAIDTLIEITNNEKAKVERRGFEWNSDTENTREFRGLTIQKIGSFKRRTDEFRILLLVNKTSRSIHDIQEESLINTAVLGSIEDTLAVEFMSIDKNDLEPNETTLLYVSFNHKRTEEFIK